MFRKSKSKMPDRGKVVDTASRTAAVASHAARDATRAAAPVVRRGAHTAAEALSEAAERAAQVLSETADKLAKSDTSDAARRKLADSTDKLASRIRPKKRHRARKFFFLSALLGGVVAVVKSPLRTKVANRLFGEIDYDEEPAITLPADDSPDGEASAPRSTTTRSTTTGTRARAKAHTAPETPNP